MNGTQHTLLMVAYCAKMHPDRYPECLEHDARITLSRAMYAAHGLTDEYPPEVTPASLREAEEAALRST